MIKAEGSAPSKESDEGKKDAKLELDVNHATNRVWLVKIPTFVMERWERAGPDSVLGTVRVQQAEGANGGQQQVSFVLHDPSDTLPRDYKLGFTPSSVPTHVFTEDEDGRAKSVEGFVDYEAVMSPADMRDPRYLAIMKSRMQSQKKGKRSIQMVDQEVAMRATRILPSTSASVPTLTSTAAKRKKAANLERIPKEELIQYLFTLFEQYAKWTMKGLLEKTKQPVSWLKEILGEIATYHRRGVYRGCYELLPEYQAKHAAPQDSIDPTTAPRKTADDNEELEEDDDDHEEFEEA